jgi:anhydro-N-acetylmuramic acid kinase
MPQSAHRAADKPRRLIAGAMSGTSADGIDVAIVEITGSGLGMSAKLIRHHARPYDAALKQAIFALRGTGQVSLAELARVGREISLAYATCVNEALSIANLKSDDLAAIAAHGQTLYHDPPNTIQWLDPALIAAETGCPVVSDFRRADCAAGGQGAPLVPFADYVLFRHERKHRVLVNIGGIANLTSVPAGAQSAELIAFDTGPGNCICDDLMRRFNPTGPGVDVDGAIASSGVPIPAVRERFLTDPFFTKMPPKSTDGPTMIQLFARASGLAPQAHFEDLLATACMVTAAALCDAIESLEYVPDEVIVSGGGARNPVIMGLIRDRVRGELKIMDELEIASEAKEAIAFALLGAATLDNVPSNIPSCTGSKHPVVLGSITPKPIPSNPHP